MTPEWLWCALLDGWRGHHWGQERSQLIALIKKTQSFNLSLDKNWSSTSHELHTGSRALKSDRKLWPPARLPWHIGTRTAQQPNVMLGVPLPHTRHMARLRNFSHRYRAIANAEGKPFVDVSHSHHSWDMYKHGTRKKHELFDNFKLKGGKN